MTAVYATFNTPVGDQLHMPLSRDDPEHKQAARRYLKRHNATDLAEMLGLEEDK